MGSTASKPSGEAPGASPAPQQQQNQKASDASTAACPLGFDKMARTAADEASTSPGPGASAAAPAAASSFPEKTLLPGGGGGSSSAGEASPALPAGHPSSSSVCPVKEENRSKVAKYLHPHKYNVYSQRIDSTTVDPTNNMPANPNQQPAPGQEKPLSTSRVASTIPKGGEESTWTYPSPQMFWNALTRKGKAEGTQEDDMDMVVSIHNNMNELTWKKILEWEKIRSGSRGEGSGDGEDGSEPRLLRFLGRPNDTTPKALAKMMLGHPLPFDRHDWVVDRGGDERRYVIDYYFDDGAEDEEGMPELHAEGAVKSIKVDVRPALDGLRDVADRFFQMPLARLTGKSDFVPLSLWPSPTMKAREPWAQLRTTQGLPSSSASVGGGGSPAPAESETAPTSATAATSSSGLTAKQLERDARAMQRINKKCAKPFEMLQAAEGAGDVEQAAAAALKLEYCTARYACRREARAYKEALSYADSSGSIIGGDPAHAYWAENALERRLDEMRWALGAFTDRQVEAQRREGGGQGGADA
eukprot:g16661.t1